MTVGVYPEARPMPYRETFLLSGFRERNSPTDSQNSPIAVSVPPCGNRVKIFKILTLFPPRLGRFRPARSGTEQKKSNKKNHNNLIHVIQ